MKIILNNREEILDTPQNKLNINDLLKLKRFSFPRLIVRINGELIKRDNFNSALFQDGDKIDVIHMISGG